MVVELQDLDNQLGSVRVLLAEEAEKTLCAAEQGLFVALRGANLCAALVK